MIKNLFIIFLLAAVLCPAQTQKTIQVINGTARLTIPVYLREGTVYIPVNAFAKTMGLKTWTDNEVKKINLYGEEKDLIVTAKNPFLILKDKKGKLLQTIQLPVTTHSISNDIYIPYIYCEDILSEIINSELVLDEGDLVIEVNPGEKIITALPKDISSDITAIDIDEKANGSLIHIRSQKAISAYSSSFSDGVLTVVLRGVVTDSSLADRIRLSTQVKNVRIIPKDNETELLFFTGDDYSASELISQNGGKELLLTIHNRLFEGKDQNKFKEKWEFDVIVIDAGHGGKDAGAIGINGVREKDINLAIAKQLGRMIENELPGVRVEYTRNDDYFVELYKRGKIANEKNGKLFISIHCNSTPNKKSTASGFEVYLLRPGRTQEAINIAERENSVISMEENPDRYQKLTDENFILVSMAHSAYMKYSEKFSEYLDTHFSSGFGLPNRGVKQAGFYVLVGASMPSVLIEAGFLSNKTDAEYLNSRKGQQKTAELILQSIKSFKGYYDTFLGTSRN